MAKAVQDSLQSLSAIACYLESTGSHQEACPAGIAYIGHNCLPGWAPVILIRQLQSPYQSCGGGVIAGPVGMIEGALQLSGDVVSAGSTYFRENPVAGYHLEMMMKQAATI